jgi:hypothetical protein
MLAGDTLTKPGRLSTARWGGSGERGGKEYARNLCRYVLYPVDRLKSGGYGPGAVRPAGSFCGGNFPGGFLDQPGEAMGKVCGVPMAMPLGHSRAPPPPSE